MARKELRAVVRSGANPSNRVGKRRISSSWPGIGPQGEDIAWTYTHPLDEVATIKGMVCFYSERTDLELDGVAAPRPVTAWSSPADQARS